MTSAPDPSTLPTEMDLTDEHTLIVAITASVGGVIFIILLLVTAAICRLQNKAKKRETDEMRAQDRMSMTPVRPAFHYGSDELDRTLPKTSTRQPSYQSRDKSLERSQQRTQTPMALPIVTSGHSVYRNPIHNVSTVEDEFDKSRRDDVINVIARERMMHAVDEREKYESESRVQPNYALFKDDRSRGDNRIPSRGFNNEGFTSNDRGHNSRPGHSYAAQRVTDEPRYRDSSRAEESRRHEDLGRNGHQTTKTRAVRIPQNVEDHSGMGYSPAIDRRTQETPGFGGSSPPSGRLDYDNEAYGRHTARRGPSEGPDYLTDPTRYNQGRPLDYDDSNRYDLNHWRPDTKPHVYGNRR